MTSYQRTQVYLPPEDHGRLRRLAAERGQSMTDLVREAVADYLADEVDETYPDLATLRANLESEPRYDGIPAGPEGLLSRSRARASAVAGDDTPVQPEDRELGELLWREHQRHRDAAQDRHRTG